MCSIVLANIDGSLKRLFNFFTRCNFFNKAIQLFRLFDSPLAPVNDFFKASLPHFFLLLISHVIRIYLGLHRLITTVGIKPCHLDPMPQDYDFVNQARECLHLQVKISGGLDPFFDSTFHIFELSGRFSSFFGPLVDFLDRLKYTLHIVFDVIFDDLSLFVTGSHTSLRREKVFVEPAMHFSFHRSRLGKS